MKARHQAITVLMVGAIASLAAGSQYSLSAWSPQLKMELNCTQSDIETVGTLGNVGTYLSPLSGVLVYALPEIYVALICAICTVVGLLPMALAVLNTSGFVSLRNTTILGFLFLSAGFGSGMLYSLCVTVNLGNTLPNRRGSVLAVLATLFGFSASIYTFLYNGPLHSNVGHFFIVLLLVVTLASLTVAVFLRRLDPAECWSGESDDFQHGLLFDDQSDHGFGGRGNARSPPSSKHGINKGASVIKSPMNDMSYLEQEEDELFRSMERDGLRAGHHPSNGILISSGRSSRAASVNGDATDGEDPDEDIRSDLLVAQESEQNVVQSRTCGGGIAGKTFGALLYLMGNFTFWCLTLIFFCVGGSGLMVINNVGHIVQSLNDGKQDGDLTTYLILVLSLANGGGRLAMGLSDYVKWRKGVWLAGVCVLMSLTQFANAYLFTSKQYVIFGVLGCGLAYGASWAIIPIIVSDNFGASSFSMNLGWISSIVGPASVTFNSLAGKLYDQQTPAGSTECVGAKCYRDAFVVAASCSAFAFLVALFVIPNTQRGQRKIRQHQSAGK
jgi:MFS family permease